MRIIGQRCRTAFARALAVGMLVGAATERDATARAATENHRDVVPVVPCIAIIIDDVGNRMKGTDGILSIHEPLTVAIMPYLQTSRADALRAHAAGDEVILHLPMEPYRGRRSWLGPGAITTNMSDQAIRDTVRRDIDSVPFVVGLNNHMGSKATSNQRVVRVVAAVAKEKHLFLIDSGTSYRSQVCAIARQMGVPCMQKSLFLDDVHRADFVARQVRLLAAAAKAQGWAIGIGHVGAHGIATYKGIIATVPYIRKQGVRVVPVSALIHSMPP